MLLLSAVHVGPWSPGWQGSSLLYQQAAEGWLEQEKLQLLLTESGSALNAREPPS